MAVLGDGLQGDAAQFVNSGRGSCIPDTRITIPRATGENPAGFADSVRSAARGAALGVQNCPIGGVETRGATEQRPAANSTTNGEFAKFVERSDASSL